MTHAYQSALQAARAASQAYSRVLAKYRARQIGDDEYLAARRVYKASSDAFDRARDEQYREAA